MSTFTIESLDHLPSDTETMIEQTHAQDEAESGIICNYKPFYLVSQDSHGAITGVLKGYIAFSEIYVDDLLVMPGWRGQGIGRALLAILEQRFKGQGYNNINLVTSHGQAPEFYKKCGYDIEFVRENKHNPTLSKTFFIKYFDNIVQTQGVLRQPTTQ